MVGKFKTILRSTRFDDILIEVQDMLYENVDILVDDFTNELPSVRSISHQIDLIPGASFPNKVVYRMTPKENGEIKNQV